MRFSLFALTALAVSASASSVRRQTEAQITECIMACAAKADFGDCSPTDNACLCKRPEFVNSVTACVPQQCPDIVEAVNAASRANCEAAGVTLSETPEPTPSVSGEESAEPSVTPSVSGSGSAPVPSVSSPAGSGSHSNHPSASGSGAPSPSGSAPPNNGAASLGINAASGLLAIGLSAVLAL